MNSRKITGYKIISYFFFLVVLYLIQTNPDLDFNINGINVDVLPVLVAAVALYEGPFEGAVIGGVVGVLYDISGVSIEGLYPAFFILFGIVAGIFGIRYFKKNFLAGILLSAAAMIVIGLIRGIVYFVILNGASFQLVLKETLWETLVAMIFSPLVFLVVYGINKKLTID